MQKIIFVINNLETGGVQKSLLNLLYEIHNDYDITLLTFFGNDDTEKLIPSNVKIITPKGPFRQLGLSATHAKSNPFLYTERAFWVTLTKMLGRSFAFKLMCLFRKKQKAYDVAVSFIHESPKKNLYGGCNEYVLKMIDAKQKIGWLHCDFERSGANNAVSKKIYKELDTIVACSEGCKKSFIKCMPEYADKAFTVRNCNDYGQIVSLASEDIKYDSDYFNIVTVARLSKEKALDRALTAISNAINAGYKIKYHVVGDGDQKDFLASKVSELKLEDHVIFYGNKQNPYPYIKAADLFLLTSYHEAAPMVFDESACLGVPVLSTVTTSTDEMIISANAGYVCENSQEGINGALLNILANQNELTKIRDGLKKRSFTNKNPKTAFDNVLNRN